MKINASRVCSEALRQHPNEKDLGAALLFAASKTYRKRSAEVGLAVLKMIEQYAARFEKSRLEVAAEFAAGKVTIEKTATRFATSPDPSQADCLAELVGSNAAHVFCAVARGAWAAGRGAPRPHVLQKLRQG